MSSLSGTVSVVIQVIQSIPADSRPSQWTGETFNCKTWLKDALAALDASGTIRLPMGIDDLFRVARHRGIEKLAEAELGHDANVENDPEDDMDYERLGNG
ncbi:hypothetical protein N657DRAFT_691541 [Parathielavia appendiculata]|uniref:Uncharacterized protein n=1 Tax=Parathielavia appendiculata TaxID=2587402 RepID=A0AAN6Z2A5_9PEZI|nr:hypothetical protein N657DRAFT_691541 [Parathielavia appendiculata]